MRPLDALHASSKRIATLAVVGEGPTPRTPATQTDLNRMRASYSSWTTSALDPAFMNIGGLFDPDSAPVTIFIDTRTMEIVAVKAGIDLTTAQVDEIVSGITSGPPLY
ncbi:hypothetical protein AKJ09_06201 [Labilithrix luteola]|uniref:Uncharacterized protein n=1 Tax=Labilithrix luteola TaxID=1391654 RepID=A0A0K1Q1C5_9BACT|nr:hypothetical protein [Labilithrix luteola]AKU99537.1 hypothetical protein AKJ09_06201 [Labilithrix luteola]